jgi:DNA mismatch endonuclease (patch repair protein)
VHGQEPRSNTDYWSPKLKANVERDREVNAALEKNGWHVIRIWEHTPLEEAANKVRSEIAKIA